MEEFKNRIYSRYISVHTQSLYGSNTIDRIKKHFPAWRHYYGPLLPTELKARILDIGCGDGSFVFWLHSLGYENACGIDVSPEQIEKGKSLGIKQISCHDLFDYIKNEEQPFNYIIARDVVEHFNREEVFNLLDTIHTHLSHSGKFLIQVPNGEGIYYTTVFWGDYTHEMAYTMNSIRQIIQSTGFTGVTFRPTGPAPIAIFGRIRWFLWQFKLMQHKFWKMVETGSPSGIFTQNIIALISK